MIPVELHRRLTEVFRDVFEDPRLEIADFTTASDIEKWDSLTHVSLIVATEKEFGVRFTTKEVKGLANVGDFMRLISIRTM